MTTTYELDPTHSTVAFSVRHMMVTHQRGLFRTVSGRLVLDRHQLERSALEATIDVASIETHHPQRDEHLRSADFFEVSTHPTMRFLATRFEVEREGLRITGQLTLKGVTREVSLQATPFTAEQLDPFGMLKVGISATTTLSRKAYGLVWNRALEAGGVAVGDEVTVTLDVQFQRPAQS